MSRGGVTLLGATAVFLVGVVLGFNLLTSSAEPADPGPTCTDRTVAKGEKVTSNLVKVDVYNASGRAGIANRVSINLQRNGFLGGEIGNSTSQTEPKAVAILTDDESDPRVKLLAEQFGEDVQIAPDDITSGSGIAVVLGKDFNAKGNLKKDATTEVDADRDLTVCVPVVQVP